MVRGQKLAARPAQHPARHTAGHAADDDRRALFVGIKSYVAAGGGIITDLFASDRYLTNAALLERLAAEILEREAEIIAPIEQKTDILLGLVAHCVACTVRPERSVAADRLATAVKLDMTQWWQPTAGYFALLPKAPITEAVTEGQNQTAADNIVALKKSEMATKAAELLTGTGWLPALLRAA